MKPSCIIVGLGNPGTSYAQTRHNVGWLALDHLAAKLEAGQWKRSEKFDGEVATAGAALLLKPHTFMNLSGQSVRKAVDFYKLPPERVLVLSDDIDVSLGDVRFRQSGGPGTHNGLKSLVETLGEGFARVRLGLGKDNGPMDLAAWVLSVPSKEEQSVLAQSYEKAATLAVEWLAALKQSA